MGPHSAGRPGAAAAAWSLLGDSSSIVRAASVPAAAAAAAAARPSSSSSGSSECRWQAGGFFLPRLFGERSRFLLSAAATTAAAAPPAACAAASPAAAAAAHGSRVCTRWRGFCLVDCDRLAASATQETAATVAAAAAAVAAAAEGQQKSFRSLLSILLLLPSSFLLRDAFKQQQQQQGASGLNSRGPRCDFPMPQLRQSVALCEQPEQQPQPQQQQQEESEQQLLQQRIVEPQSAWPPFVHPTHAALQRLGLAVGVSQVAANNPVEDRALFAAVAAAAPGAAPAVAAPAAGSKSEQQLLELAQQMFEGVGVQGDAAAAGKEGEEAPRHPSADRRAPSCLVGIVDGHGGPEVGKSMLLIHTLLLLLDVLLLLLLGQHRGLVLLLFLPLLLLAEYVHRWLPRFVEAELLTGDSSEYLYEEKALRRAFARLDDAIAASVDAAYTLGVKRSTACTLAQVGACCLVLLLTEDRIIVANSGDCMAVLQRGSSSRNRGWRSKQEQVVVLNQQHNANSPEERRRLQQIHPNEDDVVLCKRQWQQPREPQNAYHALLHAVGLLGHEVQWSSCYVKGRLQPTRVFGDFLLKDPKYLPELQRGRRRRHPSSSSSSNTSPAAAGAGAAAAGGGKGGAEDHWSFPYVSVEPQTLTLQRGHEDDFILVGTDGLWDFLSPEEAAALVRDKLKSSSNSNSNSSNSSRRTQAAKEAADAYVDALVGEAIVLLLPLLLS
ncbi:hypothetical protein Esti_003162 [Eimeria stiedai]